MSSQGKLSIRPLPHLDFVLGWPGIAANKETSRNAAHVAGNVEIRMGSKGIKASWLRIELRKIETVPGGENWGELIGSGPIDVWSARSGGGKGDREQDADGSCWEILKSEDFPFRINIPEALPPSAKLDKLCGVQYEVVTSLCVKQKKGLLRKEDVTSVMQSVQPITLDKHEMHSTWPKYNQPDTHSGERDNMRAKLRRERYCYAPGDKVKVKVIVQSNRVEPAKLKSVAVTIKETVTFHGVKPNKKTNNSNSALPSMQRVEVVTQKAKQIGKKIYKGDSKDYDLELIIPKNHALMSIATAKHIEVSYTMRLYVDISKAPIVVDHIPMVMTTFPRQSSLALMKKIGFVEGLSERELLIDDDVDDASTTQGVSRSARPIPTRSLSFAGSTSTGGGIGYGDFYLQRRDTVTTNATGGMAGRGVPGRLYDFNPYGGQPQMQSPSPFAAMMTNEGPTSAFMAQQNGVGQDESTLSFQERSALYHHTDDPRNAMAMGVDYGAVASLEPNRAAFLRSTSPGQRSSFPGFSSSAASLQRPATANAAIANAASEEEKERLYVRAREQAERNQRRADEARAALAAGTLPNPSISNEQLAAMTASNTLPASESEKLRLWERARRQAESYQRSFSEGANFPNEGSASTSRIQTPSLAQIDEDAPLSATQSQPQSYPNPHDESQRPISMLSSNRNSAMFWLDNPAMAAAGPPAPMKKEAERTTSTYPSYPSAEEEKKRLYERAKAETDAHMSVQTQEPQSSSVTASSSTNITPASSAAYLGDAPSYSAGTSITTTNNDLSEKEQMKRFYAAQDAVQQYQANLDEAEGSGVSPSVLTGSATTPQPMSAGTSQNGLATATATASSSQPLSEKEQLARYHAAQAEVQRHLANAYDSQGASSSSSSAPITTAPITVAPQQQLPPQAPQAPQPQPSQPTALSEKEQLARYHAAQAEVERYTTQQATMPSSSCHNTTALQPPQSSAQSYTVNSAAPVLSEKEQMRQYWEARDREAQKTSQAAAVAAATTSGSSSNTLPPPTNGIEQKMASPRPVYAPNFHGLPFTAPGNIPGSPATTPLPQVPFKQEPSSTFNGGGNLSGTNSNGSQGVKPRVVSYTPTTQYSQNQQQQQQQSQHSRVQSNTNTYTTNLPGSLNLPPFSKLTLNHRGGTPNPFEGPWAPKIASPIWADDHLETDTKSKKDDIPPPLPPKTMLSGL